MRKPINKWKFTGESSRRVGDFSEQHHDGDLEEPEQRDQVTEVILRQPEDMQSCCRTADFEMMRKRMLCRWRRPSISISQLDCWQLEGTLVARCTAMHGCHTLSHDLLACAAMRQSQKVSGTICRLPLLPISLYYGINLDSLEVSLLDMLIYRLFTFQRHLIEKYKQRKKQSGKNEIQTLSPVQGIVIFPASSSVLSPRTLYPPSLPRL